MVVPTGKVLPLGGTLTTLTEPQLSVAPTTKVTLLLLHWPASADRTMLVGQMIDRLLVVGHRDGEGADAAVAVSCRLRCW